MSGSPDQLRETLQEYLQRFPEGKIGLAVADTNLIPVLRLWAESMMRLGPDRLQIFHSPYVHDGEIVSPGTYFWTHSSTDPKGPAMDQPQTYRKRPTTIEAIQWTGNNVDAVRSFVGKVQVPYQESTVEMLGFSIAMAYTDPHPEWTGELWVAANKQWLPVETGEWIAKDSQGCYPIKNEVFTQTYDEDGQQAPTSIPVELAEVLKAAVRELEWMPSRYTIAHPVNTQRVLNLLWNDAAEIAAQIRAAAGFPPGSIKYTDSAETAAVGDHGGHD